MVNCILTSSFYDRQQFWIYDLDLSPTLSKNPLASFRISLFDRDNPNLPHSFSMYSLLDSGCSVVRNHLEIVVGNPMYDLSCFNNGAINFLTCMLCAVFGGFYQWR